MFSALHKAGEAGHLPLVFKKQSFAVKPSTEAHQRPVCPDDAVRGHDRNRVAAVGQTDRPAGAAVADLPSELRIAPRLPVGNLAERSPYAALEMGPGKVQVNVELGELARKIGCQLVGDVPKSACVPGPARPIGGSVRLAIHMKPREPACFGGQRQRSDRAVHCGGKGDVAGEFMRGSFLYLAFSRPPCQGAGR